MARPRESKWLKKVKAINCADPDDRLEERYCRRISLLKPELAKRFKFLFSHDGDDMARLDVLEKKTKTDAGFVAVKNVPSLEKQEDYEENCEHPDVHQAEINPQYRGIGLYQEMLRRMTYELQDEYYCSRLRSTGGSKLTRTDAATKAWAKIPEATREGDTFVLEGLRKAGQVCVTDLEDGTRSCSSLASFARSNQDDPELVRRARALRPGASFTVGGGAAPTMRVSVPRRRK